MRTFIKTRQQQTEKFLKKIVDTNTHVRNVDGVNFCSGIVATELNQLGFTQEIFPQMEVGNIAYFTNSFNDRLDYLVLLPIDNNVKLAMHENFYEHEQYIEGTGIWENKGGIAILLSSLQALRFTRNLKKINIGVLLITDSSIDGKYSKSIIVQKSENAENVVSLSGSSKNGGVILSRSGSASYRIEMKMMNKNTPENVSLTALNFNKTLASITDISKNDSNNIIAPYEIEFKSNIFKMNAHGKAGINIRYNSDEVLGDLEKKMKKILSQQKRSKIYQVQIEGGIKRPAMPVNEHSKNFFNQIRELARQIDVRITEEYRWSSADICHVQKDMPKVDGLGPVGEYLPSENERIIRHSLTERSLLLSLIFMSHIKK